MLQVEELLTRINPMRLKARAFFLLISFSLMATPALAQDEVLKADWIMPAAPTNIPSQGIVFMEPTLYPNSLSYLTGYGKYTNSLDSVNEKRSEHICKSVNTESCATDNQINYKAYIPVCNSKSQRDCIEEFWFTLNGKRYKPSLDSYMPAQTIYQFPADSAANLPEGKSTSIWQLTDPDFKNEKQIYAVSAVFTSGTASRSKNFLVPNVSVVIDKVEIVQGRYKPPTASTTGNGWSIDGCLSEGCSDTPLGFCAAVDNGFCAKRVNNKNGVRYGIKMRISDPPLTWIHGRLSNPEFLVSETNQFKTWSVEADPVVLPVIAGWMPNSEWAAKLNPLSSQKLEGTSWSGPLSAGEYAIQDFNKWIPFMSDKAQALQSRWSFGTIGGEQIFNGKSLKQCLSTKNVAGIVMTNATVYQDGPPSWNSMDTSLDYKVAAPHFTPTGKEFQGNYQLRINSDFARCIYGLKNVPLTATVSVIGNEGTSKIATSSISMSSDWINFNVSGFTFSTPTIKVQLAEAKKDVVEVSPVEVATAPALEPVISKVNKKSSITCVKGKVTKKVTAVKPKCPAGYKKK
jgi:hypothetical protein